jgi:hypothetical protein
VRTNHVVDQIVGNGVIVITVAKIRLVGGLVVVTALGFGKRLGERFADALLAIDAPELGKVPPVVAGHNPVARHVITPTLAHQATSLCLEMAHSTAAIS